jgi:molecular chaperone HtpG
MFKTVQKDEFITLQEYIDAMPEEQTNIYYASGKNKEAINALPQMDLIKQKGYDVLLFTDDIDEFMVSIMMNYKEKQFKSINQGDLDLIDDTKKEELDALQEEKKPLLDALKEALQDKVNDVTLSKRLTDSPVCIVSGEGLSLEMEKVLKNLPQESNAKAQKILEINPHHELFTMLEKVYQQDKDKVAQYSKLLYAQALLIEGVTLEDPVEFSNLMVQLMLDANK